MKKAEETREERGEKKLRSGFPQHQLFSFNPHRGWNKNYLGFSFEVSQPEL